MPSAPKPTLAALSSMQGRRKALSAFRRHCHRPRPPRSRSLLRPPSDDTALGSASGTPVRTRQRLPQQQRHGTLASPLVSCAGHRRIDRAASELPSQPLFPMPCLNGGTSPEALAPTVHLFRALGPSDPAAGGTGNQKYKWFSMRSPWGTKGLARGKLSDVQCWNGKEEKKPDKIDSGFCLLR